MSRQQSFECGVHLLKSDGTILESWDKDMELNISSTTDSICSIEASTVHSSFIKQVPSSVANQNSSLNCVVDSGYHSWSNIDCSKDAHESDVASQSVGDENNMQSTDVSTLQCNNILNNFDKINPATCHNCCLLSKNATRDSPSAQVNDNLESYHEAQNSVYSKVVDNNANHIHQSKVSKHHEPSLLKSPIKNGVCKSCSHGIHLFASVATVVQYQNGHNNMYQDPSYVCSAAPSHDSAVKPHALMNGQSSSEYKTDVQDLAIKIEFCLMFGFTATQIRAAVSKLSCSASKNDILAELSSMQSAPAISTSSSLPLMNQAYDSTFGGHNFENGCAEECIEKGPGFSSDEARSRGPLSMENEHEDNEEDKSSNEEYQNLRPIVIDGSNVAMRVKNLTNELTQMSSRMAVQNPAVACAIIGRDLYNLLVSNESLIDCTLESHGNKQYFSCKGILLAVDFFRQRNHTDITVFVPTYRKESRRPDVPTRGREILAKLEEERILVYTPSRWINGKRVTCYDDRFILKLAQDTGGIVVSNDHFRDLQSEKPEWKELIDKRLLMYSFASDRFMAPDDPLGKNGPTIDNFLRKRPASEEQFKPQCPYGPKCTYGRKCKYFHPECARSVTDGLKKSDKRVKASNTAKQLAHELYSTSKTITPKMKSLKQIPAKANDQEPSALANDRHEAELREAKSTPGIKLDNTRQSQHIGIEGEQIDYYHLHNGVSCEQQHLPHSHVQSNRRPISSHSTQEPVMTAPYPQYQSSCDGLCDSLSQKLTVSGQLSGQRCQVCPCRRNGSLSNPLCYDLQRQMFPMVNEQLQCHNSFSNSRITSQQYLYTEAGPPDFHADHSSVKKPLISQANGGQQYQRSLPTNLHIYDGRHASSVIHPPQHVNITAPYQHAPSMHVPYGMYSQPIYRTGYGDAQYQPNHHQSMPQQLMYPYPMSGNTQSAPRMHQSMGPGSYFVSSLNPSTGSDNSLSHTYPFLASPDGQVVAPVQKNLSSPNNSDPKTYPPPRMTRRVYSSPGHQGMQNIHQGHNSPPHHNNNNPNYGEVHRQQMHHRLQHVPSGGPSLNSPDNPRHHLFQNLCGLLEPHVVKKVMTAHPSIREPKVLIELCLKESD